MDQVGAGAGVGGSGAGVNNQKIVIIVHWLFKVYSVHCTVYSVQ